MSIVDNARAYRCLAGSSPQQGGWRLRTLGDADIEPIRIWRNAQLSVLRQQEPVTPDAQRAYYARAIWPQTALAQPDTILVAYERDGVLIGYGGLVHVAWPHRRAEVSFLADPAIGADPDDYATSLTVFLDLIRGMAFDDLGLARVFTETYAQRSHHIGVLERAGMIREGTLRDHVVVAGTPTDSILHGCLAAEWRAARRA